MNCQGKREGGTTPERAELQANVGSVVFHRGGDGGSVCDSCGGWV